MKSVIKKLIRDERGKVLILALILLVVGGLILAPLLGLMGTGLTAGQVYERKTTGLYAADAGLEDAIHWLIQGKPVDWDWDEVEAGQVWERGTPIDINNHDVYVTVEVLTSENTYKVSSVATAATGTTTVLSTLWAIHIIKGCAEYTGPHTTLYGDVYVTEDVMVEVGATIEGNLVVGGDLDLEQSSVIEGNVSVTGDVTMEQSSSITGNVCTDGDLTLGNSATITGDVFVGGNLILHNLTVVDGNVFILGNVMFEEKGTIRGSVYAYGDITVWVDHPLAKIEEDVYAAGNVTVDPSSQIDRIFGDIYEGCDPDDYPERPDCPGIPATPTKIYTYEVA